MSDWIKDLDADLAVDAQVINEVDNLIIKTIGVEQGMELAVGVFRSTIGDHLHAELERRKKSDRLERKRAGLI